jgi:hypothetical protein
MTKIEELIEEIKKLKEEIKKLKEEQLASEKEVERRLDLLKEDILEKIEEKITHLKIK